MTIKDDSCGCEQVEFSPEVKTDSADAVPMIVIEPGDGKDVKAATNGIAAIKDGRAYSKTVRVGESADGITIEPNVWYSLNSDCRYQWCPVTKN